MADGMPSRRKPGRAAAAQVGLFGIVWVKNADSEPQAVWGGTKLDAAGISL
jgi:hypothetical protein